jgi:hypothetical protein
MNTDPIKSLRRLTLTTYIVAVVLSSLDTLIGFQNLSIFIVSFIVTSGVATLFLIVMHPPSEKTSGGEPVSPFHRNQEENGYSSLIYLFKMMLPSGDEQDNIIGDLIEECAQFNSTGKAHIWLYKQAFKSVLPLIYRCLKQSIVSRLGEWINKHS